MTRSNSSRLLNRRTFLKVLAIAGVTAAGGYTLAEYAPWLDYDGQASDLARPFESANAQPDQLRELVRYATLAANGHNAQPWKFALGPSSIDIFPDFTRRLPVVDPADRELWISLGCALENLLVAARAIGYAGAVTYPEHTDQIHIDLTADTPQPSALFQAIPVRQNTRSEYDGQVVPAGDLDQIWALPLEPGVTLKLVTEPAQLETVRDYVEQGNLSQYADSAFMAELITWLRFNKKEALTSLDGLYTRASGNLEVPRWLGQMFVAGTKSSAQAEADTQKLRSSAGAVVLAASSDDTATWVRTGQVYERLGLTLTAHNLKSAFLNQPIEQAALRSQFQQALGLGRFLPQLLVRFGYAPAMPRSLRRAVDQVLIPLQPA